MLHPSRTVQRSKLSVHRVRTAQGMLWNARAVHLDGLSRVIDPRHVLSVRRARAHSALGHASALGKSANLKSIWTMHTQNFRNGNAKPAQKAPCVMLSMMRPGPV